MPVQARLSKATLTCISARVRACLFLLSALYVSACVMGVCVFYVCRVCVCMVDGWMYVICVFGVYMFVRLVHIDAPCYCTHPDTPNPCHIHPETVWQAGKGWGVALLSWLNKRYLPTQV